MAVGNGGAGAAAGMLHRLQGLLRLQLQLQQLTNGWRLLHKRSMGCCWQGGMKTAVQQPQLFLQLLDHLLQLLLLLLLWRRNLLQ